MTLIDKCCTDAEMLQEYPAEAIELEIALSKCLVEHCIPMTDARTAILHWVVSCMMLYCNCDFQQANQILADYFSECAADIKRVIDDDGYEPSLYRFNWKEQTDDEPVA